MTDLYFILKDAPTGLKLYSPCFGNVLLIEVSQNEHISVKSEVNGEIYNFDRYGKLHSIPTSEGELSYDKLFPDTGECMLFPSCDVRDWLYDGKQCWESVIFPQCVGSVIVDNDNFKFIVGEDKMHRGLSSENVYTVYFGQFIYKNSRFATRKETEDFFKKLQEKKLFWNKETSTIEMCPVLHETERDETNISEDASLLLTAFHRASEICERYEDGFRIVWEFDEGTEYPLDNDDTLYVVQEEISSSVNGLMHKVKKISKCPKSIALMYECFNSLSKALDEYKKEFNS